MREIRELLERCRAIRSEGRPAALATIVEVEGSSYRREGARMLIEPGSASTGVLSGGCLERDLEKAAAAVLEARCSRLVVYDLQAEEEAIWGFGLGCAGKVTLLVEPLPATGVAATRLERALSTPIDSRRELRLATVVAAGGDETGLVAGDFLWLAQPPAAARADDEIDERPFDSETKRRAETSMEGDEARAPRPGVSDVVDPSEVEAGDARPDLASTAPATPHHWKSLPLLSTLSLAKLSSSVSSFATELPVAFRDFVAAGLAGLAPGEVRTARWAGAEGEVTLLLESLLPPVHLLVVGGERDVAPLLRMGRELGWETTVVDAHGAEATRERLAPLARYVAVAPRELAARVELSPRTAVVVATHRYLDDLAFLGELAAAPLGYLAVLGPARRRERLLADLERLGHPRNAGALAALHGPAGLALGGRSPGEVALSVVAEIQAALAGADARPLSVAAAAERSSSVEARPTGDPSRR